MIRGPFTGVWKERGLNLLNHRWVKLFLIAVNVLVVMMLILGIVARSHGLIGADGSIYMTASRRLLTGLSIYDFATADGFGFTYPPFAAVFFSAFAWINTGGAVFALQLLCVLGLYVLVYQGLRGMNIQARTSIWTTGAAVPLLALWYPNLRSYGSGQVDLFLAAMIAVDLIALRKSRFQGILIGLSAAIKLTPAAFALTFLVLRNWPSLFRTVGATAGAAAIGWVIAPLDSARYWGELLWQTDRVGSQTAALNQSLSAVVARFARPENQLLSGEPRLVWLAGVAAIIGIAFFAMWRFRDNDRMDVLMSLNVLTLLLISPISWMHHWSAASIVLVTLGGMAVRGLGWGYWTLMLGGAFILAVPPWWFLGGYLSNGGWSLWETLVGSLAVFWAVAILIIAAFGPRKWFKARTPSIEKVHFSFSRNAS